MRKLYICVFGIATLSLSIKAQSTAEKSISYCEITSKEDQPGLTVLSGLGPSLRSNARPAVFDPNRLSGSPYLTEQFVPIQTQFSGLTEEKSTLQMRYNVLANSFDILENDGIRVIPGRLIDKFVMISPDGSEKLFVNTDRFLKEGFLKEGFFEVLINDEVKLLSLEKRTVDRISPAQNDEESDANQEWKVRKGIDYYIALNGEVLQLNSFRKKALSIFKGNEDDVRAYIKKEGLKFKRKEDIIKVVSHYASLSL